MKFADRALRWSVFLFVMGPLDVAEKSASNAESSQKEEFVLTSEIMEYENGRHDKIISGGVLLFAFFLACYHDSYPEVPLRLATGLHIAEHGIPKTDPFTFGAPEDKRWVNPSWLFDLGAFRFWDIAGEIPLSILKAVFASLSILPLLFVRYRGPTLWWAAVCSFLAAAACAPRFFLGPEIVVLPLLSSLLLCWHGARVKNLAWPLFIAVPIFLVWANVDSSFFIGAGVLLLLGLGEVVQAVLPTQLSFGDKPPMISRGLIAFAVGAVGVLAGAATPFGIESLLFPFDWLIRVLPQAAYAEREFFGWNSLLLAIREDAQDTAFYARLLDAKLSYAETALVVLAVGSAASFFLNYGRINVGRLLIALFAIALPVLAARYAAPAGVILAVVLSLNAQEAFLDAFSTEIRITRGWVLYSQVGRMATILALFVSLLFAPTGRVVPTNTGLFGFGVASNTFADSATCQWLKTAGFTGRSFIPSAVRLPAQLAWEVPELKYLIDSRWQLFADAPPNGGDSLLQQYSKVQKALLEDDLPNAEVWKPFFDKHKITHIVFDPSRAVNKNALRAWFPDVVTMKLQDRIAVVGWAGLPQSHPDRALFEKHRIAANKLVFDPPPATKDGPVSSMAFLPPDARQVTPPTVIDWLWRIRYNIPSGATAGSLYPQLIFRVEMPGSLYLALAELRKSVSEQPDNPFARSTFGNTYNLLYSLEAGVTDAGLDRQFQRTQKRMRDIENKASGKAVASAGSNSSSKDAKNGKDAKDDKDAPVPHGLLRPQESKNFLPLRHFQMMACYRESLRAFKPEGLSKYLFSEEPPIPILDLVSIAERCGFNGYLDQALEVYQLAAIRNRDPELREQIRQRVADLQKNVELRSAQVEKEISERQKQIGEKNPELAGAGLLLMRVQLFSNNGMPLRAMKEFEDAPPTDAEIEYCKPFMAELYMELGFFEKSRELLGSMRRELIQRRGDFEYLSSQVLLAAGQYEEARKQLEAAIAMIRQTRIDRALTTVESTMRGMPMFGFDQQQNRFAGTLVDRQDVISDISREARLSFELGLVLIEIGKPKEALAAFKASLEVSPRFLWRPIIEYYTRFMPDAKLPAEPDAYIADDELVQKFARKSTTGSGPTQSPQVPAKTP